jgi:ABC-type nitrate/sulfonate/bicarbonate transport system substrate-binding protein
LIAAASCAETSSAERPGKPVPVRIGVVSRSTLDIPYYIARDRGYFRDEGLDAEIILIRSSLSIQAMIAGSLDFGTATGAAVNAIVNGTDVRVVFAMSDKPVFDLMARPEIASIGELRGKKIGFGGFGGLSDVIIRRMLSAHAIGQEEVKFLSLGQNSLTYAALKSGIIDATLLQMPQNFLAEDDGFRKLAAGADYYRAVQGGLATANATTAQRPELITKVIRATLRAMRWMKSEKKEALEFMKGPYLDLGSDRGRFTERMYQESMAGYVPFGIVDDKLQLDMIASAQRSKAAQPPTPERVFDFRFARAAGETLK